MIGLISRLTDQKGLDLINYVIDRLVDDFTQIVVIGTGDPQYENMFRHYAWKYGDRVSANICYSDDLAHKLYAAADAFLMPSRFEPCGLTQLISFRYGTVPIVRETGGLKDTVRPYNEYENTGDGFSFANYNGEEMLGVVNYAKHIYFDKKNSGIRLLNGAWQTIIHGSLPKENTKGFIIICLDILYKIKESPILKNRVEKSILFFQSYEGREIVWQKK